MKIELTDLSSVASQDIKFQGIKHEIVEEEQIDKPVAAPKVHIKKNSQNP